MVVLASSYNHLYIILNISMHLITLTSFKVDVSACLGGAMDKKIVEIKKNNRFLVEAVGCHNKTYLRLL